MNASSDRGYTVANNGDDHRHCRNIEIGRPIFDRNNNFSVQIKKSEHALGLCSDMIAFCERSGRWSHGNKADIWRRGYRDSETFKGWHVIRLEEASISS